MPDANYTIKNAAGATLEFKAKGDGSAGDPHRGFRHIQDGDDVCQGTTTDAAATAGGTGTLSAKLRALTTLLNALSGTELQVDVVGALPAGTNAIGKLAANSGVDIGDVDVTSIAAGTNHIGQMTNPSTEVSVTLSLDTLAYAAGDVLADTQEITGIARANGKGVEIRSIYVIDEDDQKQPFDILFFKTNVSLGTENAAPSITDANAREFRGRVRVSTADYQDLGGVSVAVVPGPAHLLIPDSASTNLFFACVTQGTPTHTASGMRIIFAAYQT